MTSGSEQGVEHADQFFHRVQHFGMLKQIVMVDRQPKNLRAQSGCNRFKWEPTDKIARAGPRDAGSQICLKTTIENTADQACWVHRQASSDKTSKSEGALIRHGASKASSSGSISSSADRAQDLESRR